MSTTLSLIPLSLRDDLYDFFTFEEEEGVISVETEMTTITFSQDDEGVLVVALEGKTAKGGDVEDLLRGIRWVRDECESEIHLGCTDEGHADLAEPCLEEPDEIERSTMVNATVEDLFGQSEDFSRVHHPKAPDCLDGEEHEWTHREGFGCGLFGSGGGVKTTSICVKCGCLMTEDSWGHNPVNGEVMDTTSYDDSRYNEDDVAEAGWTFDHPASLEGGDSISINPHIKDAFEDAFRDLAYWRDESMDSDDENALCGSWTLLSPNGDVEANAADYIF